MAAPNYVPTTPGQAKYYESPPRRAEPWRADRPGDVASGPPEGPGFGNQGPDQGYALKLVKGFEGQVRLASGERWEDASAGCVVVALKRASHFGRAPVSQDLEIAFRIWGFLDDSPDPDLVQARRGLFDRVDNPHHYLEARRIADAVHDSVLSATAAGVKSEHDTDWRSLLDMEALAPRPADHDDELD